MKILDVDITNFLAITSAHIKLSDRGLVLIQGENLQDSSAQSNGSGKSSIADALCWTLYGVTARGVTGNDVINDEAGKNCSVIVNIEVDGILYKIERYRKHATNKNSLCVSSYDGIKHTTLTKGTDKLTQEVVDAIIGTSLDVFRGSIYAGQEMMPDLPAMTDKQLKMLIEEAAGIEVLEKASEIARDRLKQETYVLQSITNEIEKANERVEFIGKSIVDLENSKQQWESKKTEEINLIHAKTEELIADIAKLDNKLKSSNKEAIDNQIAKVNDQLASVYKQKDKLSDFKEKLGEKTADLNQITRKKAQIATEITNTMKEIATVNNLIGKPCSECGRPFDKEHISHKTKALNKRLSEQKSLQDATESESFKIEYECEAIKKETNDYIASMTAPDEHIAKLKALQKQRDEIAALEKQKDMWKQLAKENVERIKSLKTAECPLDGQIKKSQADLETAKNYSEQMQNQLTAQELVCREKQVICRVFEPAGVRARVLDDVTPFLNTQTEKYLSTLSDGNIKAVWTTLAKSASGGLKEKFTIEVEKEHCARSFKGLSGGEKRKVRIAAALALQDLVATRATKPIDLFIGDEIDDALDPAGLERLTMILEEKAKERGSVFIISHNELRDHVDQVLTVQKLEDGTTNILEA